MSRITSGRVMYADAVKKDPNDQYSTSRRAEAEFSFEVSEGDDHIKVTAGATVQAMATVAQMLKGNMPVGATVKDPATTKAATPPEDKKIEAAAPPPEDKKAGDITDAELVSEVSHVRQKLDSGALIMKALTDLGCARVSEVPQDKRADFVKTIKALVK